MVFRLVRQLSSILFAALLIGGWCSSTIYAQSDLRSPQNRNARDARNPQQANPVAVAIREMQTSLQKLPWQELTPAAQTKIKSVVADAPLCHRMPRQKIYADPEIYQFLLQHPEMIIGFWEQLGVTQLSLHAVRENQYVLRETDGTVAAVEVLYQTNDLCIIYARGEYRGPLLAKSYQGDVLLVLRTQYARDDMNEPVAVCDLDTFIQINSLGADMLAKLFFSSLTKVADSNFEITIAFVGQVSGAASRTPNALKSTVEDITSVRQEVCTDFCDVVDRVAMRFVRRNQPALLPAARQRTQTVVQPQVNPHDFVLSTRPPADWEMDHFFVSPHIASPQPSYELSVPKSVESGRLDNTVPPLPRSRP